MLDLVHSAGRRSSPAGHQATRSRRTRNSQSARHPGVRCSTWPGFLAGTTSPVSACTRKGTRPLDSAGGGVAAQRPEWPREVLREEATEVTAKTRGTRTRQRADRAEERALLELVSHGLSEEQIQRVLACALLALDERGRDRLRARLGEETGG